MNTTAMRKCALRLIVLVSALTLSACGGSGGTTNSQLTATPQSAGATRTNPPMAAPVIRPSTKVPASQPPPLASPTPAPANAGDSITPSTAAPPTANAPTAQATANEPTAAPAAELPADEEEVEYGPGDFDYPDPTAGLADLDGYQATLTIRFEGTVNGKPESSSRTYVMLYTRDPQARQLTIEGSRGATKQSPVLMAELGGTSYELKAPKLCITKEIEEGSSLADLYEPALFLDGVIGAESAGSETVNGTAADHYTFDRRALGEQGITEAAGELWVAAQGEYLTKYRLTRKGGEDYFGTGTEGTETIEYELRVPAAPTPVEIPPACSGPVDAPLLPDATNVVKSPGALSYESPTTLANAVVFYQKELPAQGWTAAGEPATGDSTALLSFTKADRTLTVILAVKEGGGTQGNVVVKDQ